MLSQTSKQPPQKRKLKESCTQCAGAKVRCSKDKPQCTRCEDRDSVCSYGMSQRSGRRAGSTSVAAQLPQVPALTTIYTDIPMAIPTPTSTPTPIPTPMPTASSTPTSQHVQQALYSCNNIPINNHVASEARSELDDATEIPALHHAAFPDFHLDILDKHNLALWNACESLDREMTNTQTPLNCLSPGTQLPSDGSLEQWMVLEFNQCNNFNTINEPTITEFSTPRLQTPPIAKIDPDITIPPSGHVSCYQTATHILGILHSTTTTCSQRSTMSNENQRSRPTIEQVIDANRTSIDHATKILSCPCANDEQLLSLVTSIIFKIIQLYHGAAHKGDERLQHFGNANVLGEQGQHAPSVVETIHLDGTDLPRMKAQLILGEIHRVVRLVELLSTRFQEARVTSDILMRSDEDGLGSEGNWISASVFVQLESDLRKRLRVVVKDTMSIMRRG